MERIGKFLLKEWFLFLLLILFSVLYFLLKPSVEDLISSVDWRTIFTIWSLLLVAKAFERSGVFEYTAGRLISRFSSERSLALSVVLFTAAISTFLTNDVSLFVVVPITLMVSKYLGPKKTAFLVIYEAMAANVGSLLTPIGNPQNIYLYHLSGLSFLQFTEKMFPLFLLLFSVLVVFVLLSFEGKEVKEPTLKRVEVDADLFWVSAGLLVSFLVFWEVLRLPELGLVLIFLSLVLFDRRTLKEADHLLVPTFVLIFADFHLLGETELSEFLKGAFDISSFLGTVNLSILLSEIFSNVPAAVLAVHMGGSPLAVAYGVNLGANGLPWASLANLIALRMLPYGGKYLLFIGLSGIYLAVCYLLFWAAYRFALLPPQ